MPIEEKEGLRREIGTIGLAASTFNFIVGAGIFVLPALVAIILGGSSILAYLICGVLILAIMLCFAEIGSQVTTSGGAYAYVTAGFGPFAGFIASTLDWFGFGLVGDAALANALADMLGLSIPWFKVPVYRAFLFLLIFGGFVWVNIRGVRKGIRFVRFNTGAKLVPLLLLVILGIFNIKWGNIAISELPTFENLGAASLLLFFAFGGGHAALSNSGELVNPRKTVPRGILLGVGSVLILYLFLQIVSQGVLGDDLLNHSEAPLAAVGERLMGRLGGTIIIVGAVISIFGTLSGSILSRPRILFGTAKDGLLPKFISSIHPKYATPYWAIIIYAAMAFLFAISGGFQELAILSSASLLIIYLGVVLSTIRMRLKNRLQKIDAFRLPGGLVIPAFAVVVIFWFLSNLPRRDLMGIGILLVALAVIYFSMKFYRRQP